MAAPTIRAVGAVAAGSTAISPGLPAGTVAGDLLIMGCESGGTGLTVAGWTLLFEISETGTAFTLFSRVATSGSDPTTTSTPTNHAVGRIIGITAGTFNVDRIINASTSNTQTTTTAVSISGTSTTVVDTLVLAWSGGDLPDATGTTQFSLEINANLAALTERVDNTTASGNGGALYCISGTWASAADYGATTGTATNTAIRVNVSIAIAPFNAALVFHKEKPQRQRVHLTR